VKPEIQPASTWNHIARFTCTAVSLLAAYCTIHGLRDLDEISARIAHNAAASAHVPTVQPSLVFIAVCIFLLVAVALLLTWFTVPSRSAATLSLFVAFMALGYGLLFAGRPVLEPFYMLGDWIRGRDHSEPWKNAAILGVRAVMRLFMVFPMWTLAGAILLQFLSEFHGRSSATPVSRLSLKSILESEQFAILVVLVLASLCYVALLPSRTPFLLADFILIMAILTVVWLGFRHRRIRAEFKANVSSHTSLSSSRRLLSVALLVLIGFPFVGVLQANDINTAVDSILFITILFLPAICLLLLLPRALDLMSWSPYIPAAMLIGGDVAFSLLMDFDARLTPVGYQLVWPWLVVCFLLSFRLATSRLSELAETRKEQALILLAGIILASLLGLAWGATSEIYLFACKANATSTFCLIARHKDWLLVLPAMTLAVFFAIALRFPGDIDATKLFRRTTLYAALGALVIFGFGVVEHLIDDLFGKMLADETPRFIAAGAIGIVVHPVKRRLESWIDAFIDNVLTT